VNAKGGGKGRAGGGDAKKGQEEAGVDALPRMGCIQPRIRVTDQSRWHRSDFRRRPVSRDPARRFDSAKRKSGQVRASLATSAFLRITLILNVPSG